MNDFVAIHRPLQVWHRLPCLCLASLLAFFGASLAARAALILDLPDLVLQPNQPNQTFTISVQNDGVSVLLTGVRLELIVGNGDVAIGGSGGAPAFQAVSLLAPGSLFAANNTGNRGAGNFAANFPPAGLKQLFQRLTSTTPETTVTLGNGIFDLAAVTFDTTGIVPGVYSWSATTPNGASIFTDTSPGAVVNPTLFGGTLTVVPEPVNVALSIFGGLAVLTIGLSRWCCRKRSARCISTPLAKHSLR